MLADCGALELLSEEDRRQHLLVLLKACRTSAMSRDVISLSSGVLPRETMSAIASSPPTLCGIVVGTTSALPAVQQVTSTIPIILAYSVDPVGNGFVASLARPGGNITGMASALDEIVSKHVEMLKEMVPNLSRIGLLSNPASPNHRSFVSGAKAAADQARIDLVRLDATNQQEIEAAFATATTQHVGAIGVLADGLFNLHRYRIAELARVSMLPSIFSQREYAVAGGLISYGESLTDIFRHVAYFTDRIFKGVKPADLPIEQPTKFELTINLKTAKALGLDVSLSLQQRADEMIE